MQALSLAIGPAGVTYFARQLVVARMTAELARVTPPDRAISVPGFDTQGIGSSDTYSDIRIRLTKGTLAGFAPGWQGITQKSGGTFDLVLLAHAFTAHYAWHETYTDDAETSSRSGVYHVRHHKTGDHTYRPGIGTLTTVVTLGFVPGKATGTYDVTVAKTPVTTTAGVKANIPGGSVIQHEDGNCFSSHVSAATADSVSAIDFSKPVAAVFPPLIRSVAASGRLTDDIAYDFAVGDSGIGFPADNAGLTIGITGAVRYKNTPYPGVPPAGLPVPPPPADGHHVQVYVSNYELDALYWAFFQAGRLAVRVDATDLPDPDVLHCKTYAHAIKAFQRYAAFGMRADIAPKAPPTVSFQRVWVLGEAAMQELQGQLPSNVYALLGGLAGEGYAARDALDRDLHDAGIDPEYWPKIAQAAYASGLVLNQDLQFTLTIRTGVAPEPDIVFDLTRTDILQNLGLGETQAAESAAQTLVFDFLHATYAATFVSSTVPGFTSAGFGDTVWPVVGEPAYDKELAAIGRIGAPLPIMSGFHFLFDQARLSVQEGFVSILANVAYTKPPPPESERDDVPT